MGRLAKCFVALLLSAGPFTTEAQNTLSIDDLVEKATLFLDTRSDSLSQLPMPQAANGEQLSLNDSAGIWFVEGMQHKKQGDRAQCRTNYQQAMQLAGSSGNIKLAHQVRIQLARLEREERNYRIAGNLIQEALLFFQNRNDSLNTFRSYYEKGHLLHEQGRISAALHHFLTAKSYIPKHYKDFAGAEVSRSTGTAYVKLAALFSHIKPEKAIEYYNEAERYLMLARQFYDQSGQGYGRCYCGLYLAQIQLDRGNDAAAKTLIKASDFCDDYPDNEIQIRLRQTAAKLQANEGAFGQAIEQIQAVNSLKYRLLAPSFFYDAYFQLGVLMHDSGKTEEGKQLVVEAANWFEQNANWLKAFEAFDRLAQWDERELHIDQALQNNKKAAYFKNLLVNEADMELFDALRYQYKTDLLLEELEKATEAEALRRKQLIYLLVVGLLIVAIMIMALVFTHLKRKKEELLKQLAQESAAHSSKESALRELQIEQLKTENELVQQKAQINQIAAEKNEQELLLNALRKTEVLNLQQEMLGKLMPFATKFTRKSDRDMFEQVLSTYRHAANSDPMSQFEAVFMQAYGGFYSKLTEMAPDLTRSEIQIAVLLRMNLTSKEIAHILRLSTPTVERTRHQVRSKLKLDPNQPLNAALMAIG